VIIISGLFSDRYMEVYDYYTKYCYSHSATFESKQFSKSCTYFGIFQFSKIIWDSKQIQECTLDLQRHVFFSCLCTTNVTNTNYLIYYTLTLFSNCSVLHGFSKCKIQLNKNIEILAIFTAYLVILTKRKNKNITII